MMTYLSDKGKRKLGRFSVKKYTEGDTYKHTFFLNVNIVQIQWNFIGKILKGQKNTTYS